MRDQTEYNLPGKATLIELLGDDLGPKYVFTESLGFRESYDVEGKKDPQLTFMTYREGVSKEEVRDLANKTFKESPDIIFEGFRNYSGKNIKDLKDMKNSQNQEIERLSPKRFYNPFSKLFWEDRLGAFVKSSFLGVNGVVGFGSPVSLFATIPISAAMLEFSRRAGISLPKRTLEEIEKNIKFHENFEVNIENVDVSISYSSVASEIVDNVKKLPNLSHYLNLDLEKVNSDLSNAYGLLG